MIERVVRNDEVVGLIPICSTTFDPRARPAGGRVLPASGPTLDTAGAFPQFPRVDVPVAQLDRAAVF